MRIKIHIANHHSISLEVQGTLPGEDRDSKVGVTADARFGSKSLGDVKINWTAMGSRSLPVATAYADMIQFATRLGNRLDSNLQLLYRGIGEDGASDDIIFVVVSKTIEGIMAEVVR